jgi:hypothetical protein
METVEILNQQEFAHLCEIMDHNFRLKMDYDYLKSAVAQYRFPVWTLGSSNHLAFQQKDEEGKVYHCRLRVFYTCREVVLNQFLFNTEIAIIYGISASHPDTIKFMLDDWPSYKDDFDNPVLEETIQLVKFGTTKGIEKSIKDFKEWKKKEWLKSPEYLLKE